MYTCASQVVASLQALQPKVCTHFSFLPRVLHVPPISTPSFDGPNNILLRVKIMELCIVQFSPPLYHFILFRSKYLSLYYEMSGAWKDDWKFIKMLTGKLEGTRPRGIIRSTWEGNIRMDLKERRCDGVDSTILAQDKNWWRHFWTSRFHKRWRFRCLTEWWSVSQEGSCCSKLVRLLVKQNKVLCFIMIMAII